MLMQGKRVVVMGVANKWSIAWGIASKLKEQGAQVLYTYYGEASERNLHKLLTAEEVESGVLISCDVTSDEAIQNAFSEIGQRFGRVDGVVHSIAHAKKEELEGSYVDTSRDGYLMAQEISAYSLVAVAKASLPVLSEGASFVTLTYLGGERVVHNYNVMGVAKAALEASVRYLARDLGKQGYRINALSAGPIKTLAAKGVSGLNEMRDSYIERSPLGRMVTHEDISNTALYLLSHLSSGVTGENIHVDCGYHVMGL